MLLITERQGPCPEPSQALGGPHKEAEGAGPGPLRAAPWFPGHCAPQPGSVGPSLGPEEAAHTPRGGTRAEWTQGDPWLRPPVPGADSSQVSGG